MTAAATVLNYEVQAQVGGKIAQLGARLIDASAKQMADAFFDRFSAEVRPPGPTAGPRGRPAAAAAASPATGGIRRRPSIGVVADPARAVRLAGRRLDRRRRSILFILLLYRRQACLV